MPISFETIDPSIRTPTNHLEVSGARAVQGLNLSRKRVLACGIKLSAGSQAELQVVRVRSGEHADSLFGVGSQLAEMCRAIKDAHSTTDLYACAIDELTGGTKGTKTVTVTGPATADGTIHLYVAGYYVPVAVSDGDAQNDIATAINAAIQAHAKYTRMPYVSTVATNVVTLTMKWKGVDVADARINFNDNEETPAGLAVTVAAGTSGAGNPDYSEIVDVLGDVQYHRICVGVSDATNMALLETELETRYGGMVQLEGHVFAAYAGSYGNTQSLGAARNSKQSTIIGTGSVVQPPWVWAATLCAEVAAEADPAVPLQSKRLSGLIGPARSDRWTRAERDALLYDGIATYTVDDSGAVYIERCITTYQENAVGTDDVTWLDTEPKFTLEAIRYDLLTHVTNNYQRHKLADDGAPLPKGQNIMTPNTMRAVISSRFDVWADQGWVEAATKETFLEELVCERNASDVNRLDVQLGPDLMNQFRGFSGQIAFKL